MKTKLALILGIICIAVSAVTLFSVLGHADVRSLTFKDADLSAAVKGVSLLNSNPKIVRLDVAPMNFPKVGELTMVFIKFSDEYEASIAKDIMMSGKMDLHSSYYSESGATTYHPVRQVIPSFVDSEGKIVPYQAPRAISVDPRRIDVHFENIRQVPSLEDLVSKQIRDDQVNKGIYVGTYGKLMWYWDGFWTECGPNVKKACHNVIPSPPSNATPR